MVEFLLLARQQGLTFPERLLEKPLKALEEALRTDYRYFVDGYRYLERADALHALALADRFDKSYAFELATRARNQNLYSEAKVMHALLVRNVRDRNMVDTLADDLTRSIIYAQRDGNQVYEGLQYRGRSWGGPVLSSEVATLAQMTRALYRRDPASRETRVLVDDLLARGRGDGWGSTKANAAALLALSEVFDAQPANRPVYGFQLALGDRQIPLSTAEDIVNIFKTDEGTPGRLTWQSNGETGQPLAWFRLGYMPLAPGSEATATQNGFVIDRTLLHYREGGGAPSRHPVGSGETIGFPMGALVEEHVRVVNPEQRFYVAVRVPFAAGFEPMNPNLATASAEATPAGELTLNPDYALYEDDQVTFYYDSLPKGTYDFHFRLRASFAGSFTQPPAKAELMYRQAVHGTTDGCRIQIEAR